MMCGGLRVNGTSKIKGGSLPLVSVITVVYNGAKHLADTIESVLNQTYSNLEFIIIDGGSTDGSIQILQKYDSCIDFWISDNDAGIYDAMNKGIDFASGEWLNYMNCGDKFYSDDVLAYCIDQREDKSFLFSDFTFLIAGRERYGIASRSSGVLLHQSCIYKKKLHQCYGYYLVTKTLSISDYIFFMSVPESLCKKIDRVISLNDDPGASSRNSISLKKIFFDYIIGCTSWYQMLGLVLKDQLLHCCIQVKKSIYRKTR